MLAISLVDSEDNDVAFHGSYAILSDLEVFNEAERVAKLYKDNDLGAVAVSVWYYKASENGYEFSDIDKVRIRNLPI